MSTHGPDHKARARDEARLLAAALVRGLHDVEAPEEWLTEQLYPLVREKQKQFNQLADAAAHHEAQERHIRYLLKAGALVHERLLDVVARLEEARAAAPKEAA